MNADAQAQLSSETGTAQAATRVLYAPWLLLGIGHLILAGASYGAWRDARFIRRARAALAQTVAETAGRQRQDA